MMFVMEHYYDRVPLFVFPEICIKNSGISPRELFYTYSHFFQDVHFTKEGEGVFKIKFRGHIRYNRDSKFFFKSTRRK